MGRRAKGERRHGAGWQAYVTVNGETRWKTFPANSTPEQRDGWRTLQKQRAVPGVAAGSFLEDIQTYLGTVKHMPTYAERAYHLALWADALGHDRPRHTITTTEINQALSHWKAAGKSATTVRHYRTALLHLFHRLDGKDAPNPVRASWRPADPPLQPRAIPPGTLKRVLKAIRGPKTRARLRLMMATGLPHKQVMQITPGDIDWELSRVNIRPRGKGQGAVGRWLPLNKHARFALRAMDATNAWGPFSTGAMRITWRRALVTLKLPLSLRPYDVRHTAGTLLYQATGDLATVARLLGHADPRTSARYSLEAHAQIDAEAMAKVSRSLAARLPTAKTAKKKR